MATMNVYNRPLRAARAGPGEDFRGFDSSRI